MLSIFLIRHLPTEGNLQHRYIGWTDEPLCQQAIAKAHTISYPATDLLFSSPLKRCIQTAALFYPTKVPILIPNLKETNFGEFEGKNYQELSGNIRYQSWIDSNGTLPFPDGESPEEFKKRSQLAFEQCMKQALHAKASSVSFVIHGGTIMSIMEYLFCSPSYIETLWSYLYPCYPISETQICIKYNEQRIPYSLALHKTYYDWSIKNGECYEIQINI